MNWGGFTFSRPLEVFHFIIRKQTFTPLFVEYLFISHCVCCVCQILAYEGEMERTRSQLETEIQNLEEEKNRVVEEAFIRAESEMKAVHENLAGVCAHSTS